MAYHDVSSVVNILSEMRVQYTVYVFGNALSITIAESPLFIVVRALVTLVTSVNGAAMESGTCGVSVGHCAVAGHFFGLPPATHMGHPLTSV